jgi:hypothetical protein
MGDFLWFGIGPARQPADSPILLLDDYRAFDAPTYMPSHAVVSTS